ncbi:MAG: hypothetical protein ACI9HK_003078, partial [Pirellulaceae bacterium]
SRREEKLAYRQIARSKRIVDFSIFHQLANETA